jgi:hypothetical protein
MSGAALHCLTTSADKGAGEARQSSMRAGLLAFFDAIVDRIDTQPKTAS